MAGEPARARHGPGKRRPDVGARPRVVFAALAVPNFRLYLAGQAVADPRTTMRYDRARTSLDRHATYIVAAYVAGAAR